ncbi:helix-turn-helix domain-containing protein [Halogeometricum sp. S1BR25-6]|uniref:Helix-turn-helix domain-containing protein n=1 Tax=Halogeometricum salsisoli TaxID=2950536 RepID=A0ABU2GIL9_9EURY|nr:helix-turn-helix domain-containing protein [Halogeometricum sp. S1BR25-6]MDS0300667.1 helix-turn-helix domain-containing protein [Halogeometricum sp. S1BR25-6]
MASGIRATVKFTDPNGCPIARRSESAGGAIDQTSTSVSLPGERGSVTEFLVPGDDDEEDAVFSYGTATVFRTAHEDDATCPCECLGRFGCPVHRYVADDGDLTLVFHAADFGQLQTVMGELGERFEDVDVQRLLQPPLEGPPEERVFVNRGKLTDRQREVLETAYRMGYFERPKGANATEIAAELGISQSTFTEHLVTAQRKILEDVLEGSA